MKFYQKLIVNGLILTGLLGCHKELRILIDNDATAFFDVDNLNNPTNVKKIKNKHINISFQQPYNYLVEGYQTHYFEIGEYKGHLEVLAITDPCIVFCAYSLDKNKKIKSSGIYHAESSSKSENFKKNLYNLINTLKSEPEEKIIIQVSGFNQDEENLKEVQDDITKLLDIEGVEIGFANFLVDHKDYKITKFHPKTGLLDPVF